MGKKINLYYILLLTLFISFSYQLSKDNNDYNKLVNNYYPSQFEESIIDIKLDHFVSGSINNSTIYYKTQITKDSEGLFFDYQSEFGCIYISFQEELDINNTNPTIFCSSGENNLFYINKSEISEKDGLKKENITGLFVLIEVKSSSSELDNKIAFDFSLKVSLQKDKLNIFEVNSEHNILCKTEKINDNNYRCLFMFVNNNELSSNENLIVYSNLQSISNTLNIFADEINKEDYDNWNIENLNNSIPNNNSHFTNNNTEFSFIMLQNVTKDKYIFISVETNKKTIVELIAQKLPDDGETSYPKEKDIQIFNLRQKTTNINLNFTSLKDEVSLILTTIYGKAKINLGYNKLVDYVTDVRENKLFFVIDISICYKEDNKCKLIINNLETNDVNELGYIFSISYMKKSNNILKQMTYSKTSKWLYDNPQLPIMFYEKIPDIKNAFNVYLQFDNIPYNASINKEVVDIEAFLLKQNEIYDLKLNYNNINKHTIKIKGTFNSFLSNAYIYLSHNDMERFNIDDNPYLLIYISSNNSRILTWYDNFIFSSTISQENNLNYMSERTYHFGKVDANDKVVYRLEGKPHFHLMRLEIACNSNYLDWTVKRANEIDKYKYMTNDSDLSFVTEKWSNGRGLLTMYIERGEDIYLTIFPKKRIKDVRYSNFVFKYLNSAKNGDFKNYIVKHDSLTYDRNKQMITVNKLTNIPGAFNLIYFMKIIDEEDFMIEENINTIANIESKPFIEVKGKILDNNVNIYLSNLTNPKKTYYINIYTTIIENYFDVEYISYAGYILAKEDENADIFNEESNGGFIIASIVIASVVLFLVLLRFIWYCCKECC